MMKTIPGKLLISITDKNNGTTTQLANNTIKYSYDLAEHKTSVKDGVNKITNE